jgi:hypothetical protein
MTTPTSIIKTDKIWYNDFSVLFRTDRLIEFFPNKVQTLEERMNSVVRMGIYSSILTSTYKRNLSYLLWIIVVFVITYFIYKSYSNKEEFADEKKKRNSVKPTLNNPYMNFIHGVDNTDKKKAPTYYQDTKVAEDLREDIKNKFNYNLYKGVDDVYDKNNNERMFYTTPVTEAADDLNERLDFMYGDMRKSCKTNSKNCQPHEELRRNPYIFPNQDQNPFVSGDALATLPN